MKLTKNDRRALKLLIDNGRASDADMARAMNITPQAVGKIRKKLEGEGVIKSYTTTVDYEKLGISVMAIALFKFTPEARKTLLTEEDVNQRIKGPHIINFYRVPEGDVTHIVVYGFRSLEELDHYFHVLQTERGHMSEIKELFIFSSKSIRKNSDKELVLKIIDEIGREKLARPLPPEHAEKPAPKLRKRGFADMR
ncbi:MAG: Lrp/AsnC family transcriptional regulator, partial [Candidatus Altiarchaeota archaeon]|nr:Lrp/AsnC family transcriptional regulator [Candidatus Altiarchaeota archaeon]